MTTGGAGSHCRPARRERRVTAGRGRLDASPKHRRTRVELRARPPRWSDAPDGFPPSAVSESGLGSPAGGWLQDVGRPLVAGRIENCVSRTAWSFTRWIAEFSLCGGRRDARDWAGRRTGRLGDTESSNPVANAEVMSSPVAWTTRLLRRPFERVPARCRPALYFDTVYNVGAGAFIGLFRLSNVLLKTVLPGTENHLALLAAAFGGSSLFSPVAGYLGRWVSMKTLVVFPNFLVVLFLAATALHHSAGWFTFCICMAFLVRVVPRVAEMNMYRVLYPPNRRGSAVGWLKAVAAVSGMTTIAVGYWWFDFWPSAYWALYCAVAVLMTVSALNYRRIPVPRRDIFGRNDQKSPLAVVVEGTRIFFRDRRFVFYQFGFALGGTANHLALVFIPQVLKEQVHASERMIGLAGAVLPALFLMSSAPLWGRYLDRVNPMTGRATFNTIQALAFAFDAYGGVTLQVWPFLVGAVLHGISTGGGNINWLTGSLYFARSEHVSLYNAIHVCLTGIRGMLAPAIGLYLISPSGLNLGAHVFTVAAVLSVVGAAVMGVQGAWDPGPREPGAGAEELVPDPVLGGDRDS